MLKTMRMKKFRVVFLQRMQDRLVSELHELGLTQLREVSDARVSRKTAGEELLELSSLITKLRNIQGFLGAGKFKPVEVEMSPLLLRRKAKRLIEELEPKVNELRAKRKELDERREELSIQRSIIEELKEFQLSLDRLRPTERVHVATGKVAEDVVKGFSEEAERVLEGKVLIHTFGRGRERVLLVMCKREDQGKLMPLFYRYGVEPFEIPPIPQLPVEALSSIDDEMKRLERGEKSLSKKMGALAKRWLGELNVVLELLEIHRERVESGRLFGYTYATVVVEGWVPERDLSRLEKTIAGVTRGRYILRVEEPSPSEVEETPVELDNPRYVKDFEFITRMYSLPKYDEVDPTLFISITFPLFFAFCLTDAGYGLLLATFMGFGLWFAKALSPSLRKAMVACSLTTIPIGAMLGGWFGVGPVWIDPIENPIPFLKLAVFVGIFHILWGFGLGGAVKDVFRRDWRELGLGHLPRILTTIGFFGLTFSALGVGLLEFGINFRFPKMGIFEVFIPTVQAPLVVSVSRGIFYLGLALAMLGAALSGKGLREKIGGPIGVIYSLTGLVADAASYSRLMALGMATGVIAFAINHIVGSMYGGVAGLPIFIAAPLGALLVFGLFLAHCFNIFIQSLGAFIHTMRLHFVEFFSKFFEGGGIGFEPFKVKRKFTKRKGGGKW